MCGHMRSKLFLRYTADIKKKAKEPLMYESTHLSVFALFSSLVAACRSAL